MNWTIPNLLSIIRVLAAPCVALAFVIFERPEADRVAIIIFVGAAATDYLDGWLARILRQESAFGRMLDPIADKATLIRRAYFDLIGLPPTYGEVQAFVNDDSPAAWPRPVEPLPGLPPSGPRRGRPRPDVVRFAQTPPHDRAPAQPLAQKYTPRAHPTPHSAFPTAYWARSRSSSRAGTGHLRAVAPVRRFKPLTASQTRVMLARGLANPLCKSFDRMA